MSVSDAEQALSSRSMRSRHKTKEPPSWQRKLVLLAGALFGATLLLFMAWAVVLFIA
jgi:hypothetical protein